MSDRVWQRPSLVVVGAAALWLGVFAASGRLRLQSETTQDVALAKEQPVEPTVLRVGRPGPAAALVEVRGTVLDAAGFLLVGAGVTTREGAAVRSDASGQFMVSLPAPRPDAVGAFDLQLVATGHRPRWARGSLLSPDRSVFLMAPSAPWDTPAAEPQPSTTQLVGEGFVHGPDGRPVSGAYVTVKGSGIWARTDEIGRYMLPLPAEPAVLIVHQPEAGLDGHGLAVRSEPFTPSRSQGVVPLPELVAEPASLLRGRVADRSGAPLVGVPVEVRGDGFSRVLESGMSGIFRLAGLLPGNYVVRPFPHRGAFGPRQEVAVTEGITECSVAMDNIGERRIRVLDERGQPVPKVHVASAIDGERCSVAQADQEGYASVRVADARTEWEVRSTDRLEPLPVRHFEAEAGAIVVALP